MYIHPDYGKPSQPLVDESHKQKLAMHVELDSLSLSGAKRDGKWEVNRSQQHSALADLQLEIDQSAGKVRLMMNYKRRNYRQMRPRLLTEEAIANVDKTVAWEGDDFIVLNAITVYETDLSYFIFDSAIYQDNQLEKQNIANMSELETDLEQGGETSLPDTAFDPTPVKQSYWERFFYLPALKAYAQENQSLGTISSPDTVETFLNQSRDRFFDTEAGSGILPSGFDPDCPAPSDVQTYIDNYDLHPNIKTV